MVYWELAELLGRNREAAYSDLFLASRAELKGQLISLGLDPFFIKMLLEYIPCFDMIGASHCY
jgi:hypothetical protein